MSEPICSPLVYMGLYTNSISYEPLNIVYHMGNSFVAKAPTTGNAPVGGSSDLFWGRLTNFQYRGEYSPEETYYVGDFCVNSTKTRIYFSIFEPNQGAALSNTSRWIIIIDVADVLNNMTELCTDAANLADQMAQYAREQAEICEGIICDAINKIEQIGGIILEVNLLKDEWITIIKPDALQIIADAEDKIVEVEGRMVDVEDNYNNVIKPDAETATADAYEAAETTIIIYKLPVETYTNINTAYPNPENGWLVQVKNEQSFYRYNGPEQEWQIVQNIDLSMAVAKTGDTMIGDLNINASANVQDNLSVGVDTKVGRNLDIGNRFRLVRNIDGDSLDIELIN